MNCSNTPRSAPLPMRITHMTRTQHVLACCVTALACSAAQAAHPAPSSQDCEINGVAVNPAVARNLRGKSGLMRCVDHDTGVVQREQEVQNGRFTGLVRSFAEGQLQKEYSVNSRGNNHGRTREFAPGGQVVRDTLYDNGAIVGFSRRFHPNGQLQRGTIYNAVGSEIASVEFTANGQLSNLNCADKPMMAPAFDDVRACGFFGGPSQLEFFSPTGTVRARARFLAGKRIGLDTLRDNGRMVLQEEVTTTQRIERTFAADGTKRREMQWNVTGSAPVQEREQEFAANGVLVRDRRWAAGELASEMIYYQSGQLRRKAEYKDTGAGTPRILAMSEFYDSGTLSSEGAFANTSRYALTPVGVHRRYDTQGKLRAEAIYDERGRTVRERLFDDAGQPVTEDTAMDDAARKLFTK